MSAVEAATSFVDGRLAGAPPWKVVAGTAAATLVGVYVYSQLTHKVPLSVRLKKLVFKLARKIPSIREQIATESGRLRERVEGEFLATLQGMPEMVVLPELGLSRDAVVEQAKKCLDMAEDDWANGSESGTVYNGNPELTSLTNEVYGLCAWTNPLHPSTFPGIRKMEAEIVRMCCNLFSGGDAACGVVTTGGTESILLACKAYRDFARSERGITDPVIVAPVTAHAAFDKAAELLDITIKKVPVDPVTCRVSLSAMRRAITASTCMLIGSAPQFPHGVVDDIEAIGELGRTHDIPVHVDACLGGFVIAFMREAGYPLNKRFDFSVPGVTSMSADTHKYGFAPKGTAVLMYSEAKFRHAQWFTYPDWPGGIYATPTIGGSRSGGVIAACWATLAHFGRAGYVDATRRVVETTRRIARALEDVPGIKIIAEPEVCVVTVGSDDFNIYGLSDGLKQRGWNLNALQFPQCIHLCVTYIHTRPGIADRFIQDVKQVTADILKDPSSVTAGDAALYGTTASIPDRGLVGEMLHIYLDSVYVTRTTGAKSGSGSGDGGGGSGDGDGGGGGSGDGDGAGDGGFKINGIANGIADTNANNNN